MEMINTIVTEKLEAEDFIYPEWPNRAKYIKKIFTLIDPITDEEIKTYEMTKEEFQKKHFKEQKKLKSLKTSEDFDEKNYNKDMKEFNVLKEIYDTRFKQAYNNQLMIQDISQAQSDKVDALINIVRDDFEFDGMGIPEQEFKIQMEEQFLHIIKGI